MAAQQPCRQRGRNLFFFEPNSGVEEAATVSSPSSRSFTFFLCFHHLFENMLEIKCLKNFKTLTKKTYYNYIAKIVYFYLFIFDSFDGNFVEIRG